LHAALRKTLAYVKLSTHGNELEVDMALRAVEGYAGCTFLVEADADVLPNVAEKLRRYVA
jgi:hypothetical protein